MFLVFRDLTNSWRKNVFLCVLYSKYFDIRWALYSELPEIMDFIDKSIDKTFSSRNNYELVSVISKFVAPKTLVRKLPSWAGKLWKTRKIHFLYFSINRKNTEDTWITIKYFQHSYFSEYCTFSALISVSF